MEIWKQIKEWGGFYEVSNNGKIKSKNRIVYNKGNNSYCNIKEKLLKPNKDKAGYLYVSFYDKNKNITKSLKIHRLVALAFCEGYEDGLEVNHKDGNKQNNNAENLEWVTRSQNIRDIFKRGRKVNGELSNSSKLMNRDIGIIASLYDSGIKQEIIAKAFGVSQGTISNIIRNKHYKNHLIENVLAIDINTLNNV